ncbi:MAG: preprotein translocase subunit SecE [bacterium]|jgi:preprotein translocase subunit SecE
MFQRIRQFYEDVRNEFQRVHWPTREATLKSTSIVLGVSLVLAVYLGIVDLGLSNAMKVLISG